jgi:hypothetical protein
MLQINTVNQSFKKNMTEKEYKVKFQEPEISRKKVKIMRFENTTAHFIMKQCEKQ